MVSKFLLGYMYVDIIAKHIELENTSFSLYLLEGRGALMRNAGIDDKNVKINEIT